MYFVKYQRNYNGFQEVFKDTLLQINTFAKLQAALKTIMWKANYPTKFIKLILLQIKL